MWGVCVGFKESEKQSSEEKGSKKTHPPLSPFRVLSFSLTLVEGWRLLSSYFDRACTSPLSCFLFTPGG